MAEKKNIEENGFQDPSLYTNRELSWLLFDKRVLSEARDKQIPLFERLKFLSITASNLDEFFMVRVASLKDMVNAKYTKKDIAGLTASEQLSQITVAAHELVAQQYSTYNRSLLPLLKANGLTVVERHEDLNDEQAAYVDDYFEENVYPVLTPMAVDSSRPFPLIRNKSLNIGSLLSRRGEKKEPEFATVQVPSVLARIVEIPAGEDGNRAVILLEEIIERNISRLFLNYDVLCSHPFRIMRNADFSLDEEEAVDLLEEIKKQLEAAGFGVVHDTTCHDYPSYNGSYDRSGETIQRNLEKYPDIQVTLDVHRDAMGTQDGMRIKPTALINGKKAAQVMIISGCDDDGTLGFPNWEYNLRLGVRIQKSLSDLYPGLARPLSFCPKKYNEHMTKGSLLVEFGTEVNTLEEVKYSGQLFGKALAETLEQLT